MEKTRRIVACALLLVPWTLGGQATARRRAALHPPHREHAPPGAYLYDLAADPALTELRSSA